MIENGLTLTSDAVTPFVAVASVNDQFKTYLQFHPTQGTVQPLGNVTWGFRALLKRQDGQLVLTIGENIPGTGHQSNESAPKTPPTPNITSTSWVAVGPAGEIPAPPTSKASQYKTAVQVVNP